MSTGYQARATTGFISLTRYTFSVDAKALCMTDNHRRAVLWAHDSISRTGDHRALIFKPRTGSSNNTAMISFIAQYYQWF
ncbi:hypothetical protein PPNK14_14490 [Pectobacterium parmentieri]